MQDTSAPVTSITVPPGWVTGNFPASFTDTDNQGIEYSFLNVADYNGTEWRSNPAHGFFYDNFNTAIHSEWQANSGTWNISGSALVQSDQANNNTNIYAYLNQDSADVFVYEWKGTTSGTGTNRRSGLHFFSDEGNLSNRGKFIFRMVPAR